MLVSESQWRTCIAQTQSTERQQYWRKHVLEAAAYDGSIADYATINNLKTKDLYQWKTSLTKRGFLPVLNAEPQSGVSEVKLATAPAERTSDEFSSVHCRLTLPCGSVLEHFNPIGPDSISSDQLRLLLDEMQTVGEKSSDSKE